MTTPPGPEGLPYPGSGPSPEFLAMFQAEAARMMGERAAGQPEPLGPMDASMVAAHTVFQSASRAGFTDRQAIIMAVEILLRSA